MYYVCQSCCGPKSVGPRASWTFVRPRVSWTFVGPRVSWTFVGLRVSWTFVGPVGSFFPRQQCLAGILVFVGWGRRVVGPIDHIGYLVCLLGLVRSSCLALCHKHRYESNPRHRYESNRFLKWLL